MKLFGKKKREETKLPPQWCIRPFYYGKYELCVRVYIPMLSGKGFNTYEQRACYGSLEEARADAKHLGITDVLEIV